MPVAAHRAGPEPVPDRLAGGEMSIRRETVYWHGCADSACEADSHGCTRVEIWWETLGGDRTLAYLYDGGIHCVECAERRFGREEELTASRDTDGQPVGELEVWDEWWDATLPLCQFLDCSTCGARIDESHAEEACECSSRDGIARLSRSA